MRAREKILLLDDDPAFRRRVSDALGGLYQLEEAVSEEEFRERFDPYAFDLLLLDMRLRVDREGLDLLREVYRRDEFQPVIMVSAYGDSESAIEAVDAGAMMFLHKKEFSPALLARMVEAVLTQGRLRRQLATMRRTEQARDSEALVGMSEGVRRASEAIRRAADGEEPVWIFGERGAGHSLAARLVHRFSRLVEKPFLEMSGSTLVKDAKALLRRVAGGSLAIVLDGDSGRDSAVQPVDVGTWLKQCGKNDTRVMFVLRENGRGAAGPLGPDIGGAEVFLPPLREREGDVSLLAAHFLHQERLRGQTGTVTAGSDALRVLEAHDWPGNVRELRLAVAYAALRAACEGTETLHARHLPARLVAGAAMGAMDTPEAWDYQYQTARAELALVERALRERGIEQKTALAEALGYNNRHTLMRRMGRALLDHRTLAGEFPDVAALFTQEVDAERGRRSDAGGGNETSPETASRRRSAERESAPK